MFRASMVFTVVLALAGGAGAQGHNHANATQDRLGTVHFETSCNAPAQTEFDRAVALLHSFEFSRAIAGFNTALKHFPNFERTES